MVNLPATRILVLGGNRSGKSRFGLRVARELAPDRPVWFLGTAMPMDDELRARIERHRRERPTDWPTIDVGTDLPGAIVAVPSGEAILLDGLTLWISALLRDDAPVDVDAVLDGPIAHGLSALLAHPGPVVVVSDEVGGGLVPMHPGARAFRDLVGFTHQRLAEAVDEVHLLTAGIPLPLKGPDRR